MVIGKERLPADGKREDFQPREGFTTEIHMEPGHAIRKSRGDGRNYGVTAAKLRFLLHGPEATMQFLMSTGLIPEGEATDYGYEWKAVYPMGYDLGYHADSPRYEGQELGQCEYRPSGQCYYDGSSLASDPLLEIALKRGHGGVFNELMREYEELVRRASS